MGLKIYAMIAFVAINASGMPLVKFAAGKPAIADSVNYNFAKVDSVLMKVQMDQAAYSANEMQKSTSRKFLVQSISDTAPIFLDSYGLNFQGSQSGYYLGYDWASSFGIGYWKPNRSGPPFTPALTIASGNGISMLDKVILTKSITSKDPSVSLPNVLDSSYSLATIDELSTFLKLTKSLPDYPTQTDVKNNGLDLGRTNALLVKKVEELTLYVIQLNARIKALEAKP